jgi:DNA-binding transcriptional LysR family regulator
VQVPDALRSGALDIALVHEYDYVPAGDDAALDTAPLLAETIFLASAGPLPGAGEPVRRCAELAWIAATPGTLCHLMAERLCQSAGFSPRIRHHADDFATVLALVAAGQGVALVPQLALTDRQSGVVLTPLTVRRNTLIACRRGAGRDPAVAACAAAIRAATEDYLARTR